jgi:hypothetical protein
MPKLVVLTGVMQVLGDAPVEPPPQPVYPSFPIAWPDNPWPGHPIYIPGYPGGSPGPGWGGRPSQPPTNPVYPQFPIAWPDNPWPGHPIYIPGYPGGSPGPGWGGRPPTQPPPVDKPEGGMPGQLPSSDPSGSGWVFAFVPGYGWMWAYVPPKPNGGSEPHPEHPDSGPGRPGWAGGTPTEPPSTETDTSTTEPSA